MGEDDQEYRYAPEDKGSAGWRDSMDEVRKRRKRWALSEARGRRENGVSPFSALKVRRGRITARW